MRLYPSITVDLYKPYPLVVLDVPQNNIGRGAMVTLTAGGAVVIPENETVEVYAKKPDGTKVYNTVIVAGNQLQVAFSPQMTVVEGILQVELQMIDSTGNSITTPIFAVRILKSNIDANAITSSDDFQALVDALAQVQGFDQVKQSIGTLSELTTTAKNNLVAALNELNNNMTKTTAIITVPNGVSLNQNKSVICNGILYCRIQLQLTSEIGKNEKIFTVADNLQGFTQATIIDSNLNTMYPIFGMDKEFYNKHSSALSIGFYAVCFTAPL